MKKRLSRVVAAMLAIIMVVTVVPLYDVQTAQAADLVYSKDTLPANMKDNYVLDALKYLGYDTAALINNGYNPDKLGYKTDSKSGSTVVYKNQTGIKYSKTSVYKDVYVYARRGVVFNSYIGMNMANGTEETKEKKPDLAAFKAAGMQCGAIANYFILNYMHNVAGFDMSYYRTNEPVYPNNPLSWKQRLDNKWVKDGKAKRLYYNGTIGADGNYRQLSDIVKAEKINIPIGAILLMAEYKNGKSVEEALDEGHVALYAGYYNGKHYIAHISGPEGGGRGPEIMDIESFENRTKADSYGSGDKANKRVVGIYVVTPEKAPMLAGVRLTKTFAGGTTTTYSSDPTAKFYQMFPDIYKKANATYVLYLTNNNGVLSNDIATFTYTAKAENNTTVTKTRMVPTITKLGTSMGLSLKTSVVTNDTVWGLAPKTTYYVKETKWDGNTHPYSVKTYAFTTGTGSASFDTGSVTLLEKTGGVNSTSATDPFLNVVETTNVTVTKTGDGKKETQEGAVFNLYYRPSMTYTPGLGINNSSDLLSRTVTVADGTYLVGTFTIDASGNPIAKAVAINKVVDGNTVSYTAKVSADKTTLTDLPLGSYSLVEVKAPTSGVYKVSTDQRKNKILDSSNADKTFTFTDEDPPISDPVSIEIEKLNSQSATNIPSLEGTVFEVKYWNWADNNETYYDTVTAADKVTPTSTWYVQVLKDDYGKYRAELDSDHLLKTWNGKSSSALPESGKLECGTITIKEVQATPGYILNSGTMKDDMGGVYNNRVFLGQIRPNPDHKSDTDLAALYGITGVVNGARTENKLTGIKLSITNEPELSPEISTSAKDSVTLTNISNADGSVTLIDTVTYKDLKPNTAYKLTATLMDKSTKAAYKDDNGNTVTKTVSFTSSSTGKGTQDVTVTFSGKNAKGKDLVFYEELFEGTKTVAEHKDINDVNQTINFPEVSTTATDSETLEGISNADSSITLKDTVTINNLIPGKTYYLVATLYDKATGKAYLDDKGEKVTKQRADFVPDGVNTIREVTTDKFSGLNLKGKDVVFYEELYLRDGDKVYLVGEHKDINDGGQTIHFPTGSTSASGDSGKLANADSSVTITDVVTYKNLIPGKEYTITGTLMDKATNKALTVSGAVVTKTFTPTKANDTYTMTFAINGSALVGKTVVVFENVSRNGKEVFVHNDLSDTNQTIYFPKVTTTAKDKESNTKVSTYDSSVTIVDTVSVENVEAGKAYYVVGVLMNKSTNKPVTIDGKEVRVQSANFTPSTASTKVNLSFNLDVTKAGLINADGSISDVVVFERLFDENGVLLAEENNISNTDQTISFELSADIYKVDEDGNPVSGATLKVVDKSGNEIANFNTTNEKKNIKLLKVGDYVITEIKAPDGYVIAKDITFSVKADGKNYVDGKVVNGVYMVDEFLVELPSTGGNGTSMVALLGVLFLLLAFSLACKKNNDKE